MSLPHPSCYALSAQDCVLYLFGDNGDMVIAVVIICALAALLISLRRHVSRLLWLIVSAVVAAVSAETARRLGIIDIAAGFIHIYLAAVVAGVSNQLSR
jgi:uncharacterized membrane protein YgaE (UPF0421/DUF939 family)